MAPVHHGPRDGRMTVIENTTIEMKMRNFQAVPHQSYLVRSM